MAGGDLLDVHATFGRGHDGQARRRAVDQHTQVELALDVAAGLDIDALDFPPPRSRLLGDERHADHLAGEVAHFGRGLGDLDPAGLAAAAGMDLRLHGPDRPPEGAGGRFGFFGAIGNGAARDGDTEFGHQALGLILVYVHRPAARLCEWRRYPTRPAEARRVIYQLRRAAQVKAPSIP